LRHRASAPAQRAVAPRDVTRTIKSTMATVMRKPTLLSAEAFQDHLVACRLLARGAQKEGADFRKTEKMETTGKFDAEGDFHPSRMSKTVTFLKLKSPPRKKKRRALALKAPPPTEPQPPIPLAILNE